MFFQLLTSDERSAKDRPKRALETPHRVEPARLEELPAAISDLVAEVAAASAKLGSVLNPQTAGNLADLVRIMNTYYSNLIEGHHMRPTDIERALAGQFDKDKERRNLQIEAAAHVKVQAAVDRMAAEGKLLSRLPSISSAGRTANSIATPPRRCFAYAAPDGSLP